MPAHRNNFTQHDMYGRMQRLIANLDSAIKAEDLSRIAGADHALRNEVIALIGSIDLMHSDSSERLVVLNDALLAVRRAVDILVDRSAKQAVQKNAKLIYLKTERARAHST